VISFETFKSAGIDCRTIEIPAIGAPGDTVGIGQIALSFFSSGAAVALVECLKAYFMRERSLVARVKRPDGTEIEISSKNIGTPEITDAVKSMNLKG
jgi:hypothetical protein